VKVRFRCVHGKQLSWCLCSRGDIIGIATRPERVVGIQNEPAAKDRLYGDDQCGSLEGMSSGLCTTVGYIQYGPYSMGEISLTGCRREIVGTYVDCSVADPNAHRDILDGQDSKVVQDGVTIWVY
jgi:hypothetical protein